MNELQPVNHFLHLNETQLKRIAENATRRGTQLSSLLAQQAAAELERRRKVRELGEEGADTKQERRTNRY